MGSSNTRDQTFTGPSSSLLFTVLFYHAVELLIMRVNKAWIKIHSGRVEMSNKNIEKNNNGTVRQEVATMSLNC